MACGRYRCRLGHRRGFRAHLLVRGIRHSGTVVAARRRGARARRYFAEIAFAVFAYKKWNLGVTVLSGALSGVGCWGYSFFTHLQAIDLGGSYGVVYLITTVLSGALVAGVVMWYLYLGIARTGALDQFASGRAVRGAKH